MVLTPRGCSCATREESSFLLPTASSDIYTFKKLNRKKGDLSNSFGCKFVIPYVGDKGTIVWVMSDVIIV